jgi:hypothetical protein
MWHDHTMQQILTSACSFSDGLGDSRSVAVGDSLGHGLGIAGLEGIADRLQDAAAAANNSRSRRSA